jgi:hypothetical protein
MVFSSFSAPVASTISNLPHPVAKAGEPTGYPPVQLSDTPFKERR